MIRKSVLYLVVVVFSGFSMLYGQTEQLITTQERVKQRILDDIETVSFKIGELALPNEIRDSLRNELNQVKAEAEADVYPSSLTDFRAVLPFHENHAKVFSVYSAILDEKGYEGLEIWHISRFEHFDLFAEPFKHYESMYDIFFPIDKNLSELDLEMMSNEIRSQAVNITNCSPDSQEVRVTLSNIPNGCSVDVLYTVFVDTKRGVAEPSALLHAEKDGSMWTCILPSGLTTQMWFKFDSENGAAGEYKIPIKIESNVTSKEISLNLTIAPVKFPDVPDYNLSMWDGAVDVQRAITSANLEASISDMDEHLTSAYSVYSSTPRATRSNFDGDGNLTSEPSLTKWKTAVNLLSKAKYIKPIVSVQYDAGGLGLIYADFPAGSDAGKNAFKQWIQFFEKACIDMGLDLNRILITTFDEPRSDEKFKALYDAFKIVKENSNFKTYVTTGARGANLDTAKYFIKALNYTDISQPNRRHFLELSNDEQQVFIDHAKQQGKQLWFYDCGYKPLRKGFEYYIKGGWQDALMGGSGSGYWAYCDAGDNPSNWNMYPQYRSDRERDNYAPQYIDETSVTTSREWEGVAESVENGQYVLMVRKIIEKKKESGEDVTELEALLESDAPKTPKEAHDLRLKFLNSISDFTVSVRDGNESNISTFSLKQNYPNPFNPSTTIEYQVPEASNIDVKVFDINGQLIRTIRDENSNAGYHRVVWNGKNNFGKSVASGVYFIQVKYHNLSLVNKAILLK